MGGGHDLMDATSHHGAPTIRGHLAKNRQHLCAVMEVSGFASYEREWWHYTLTDEPFPDTYFDLPITP
jgi:D-alanyl-D-alanine dipeptidase